MDEDSKENSTVSFEDYFKPPKDVADAAARGLRLREKYKKGGTRVGVARANQLKNRENISYSVIKRMVSFFARHEGNQKGGPDDKGYIAWLLWGGDAGKRWSNSIHRRQQAKERKRKMAEESQGNWIDIEGRIEEESEPSQDPEKKAYDIPIFRAGEYSHVVYGDLKYDRAYLEKLVNNFRDKVVPQDISFDRSHKPEEGALAWVFDEPDALYVKDVETDTAMGPKEVPTLFAKVWFTEEGKKKVLGKQYRYFSVEISENYSTNEYFNDGENKSTISHGPTLIGGGFTNRPFITGIRTQFSEPEQHKDKEVQMPEPLLNQEPSGSIGDIMKFSEFLNTANASTSKVEFMEANLNKLSEQDRQVAEALIEAENKVRSYSSQAAQAIAESERSSARNKALSEQVITLKNDVLRAGEKAYSSRVAEYTANLKAQGHSEALVNTCKEILSEVPNDSRNVTFSAQDDAVDIFAIMTKLFSAMPKSALIVEEAVLENSSVQVQPPQEQAQIEEEESVVEFSQPEETRFDRYEKIYGRPAAGNMRNFVQENGSYDPNKPYTGGQ